MEPICQANAKANERILAGVRKLVRHGKLRRAAARFQQAASALRRTLGELKSVPRPAADEARLAKWLGDVAAEAMLFEAVARKLRAGERAGAQAIVVRLTHNATIANGVVVMFEFHYCRLEPSRFT